MDKENVQAIDLSKFVGQRVYARLRSGADLIDVILTTSSDAFPFSASGFTYTRRGGYRLNCIDDLDIIEIRPADSVTLLKWITDRDPVDQDCLGGCVLFRSGNGSGVVCSRPQDVRSGTAWAHCPGWKATEPNPRTVEINEIRRQLTELQERLEELE